MTTTPIYDRASAAEAPLENAGAADRGQEFLSVLGEASDTEEARSTESPNRTPAGIEAHGPAAIARARAGASTTTAEAPAEGSAPTAPSTAFKPTSDSRAPHLPRFADVPDAVKHPLGPYRQAPAEHGGDWWYVSPFTGAEPWNSIEGVKAAAAEEGPRASAELIGIFGERPTIAQSTNVTQTRVAIAEWEQSLEHFQGVGLPEGFEQEKVDAANRLFEEWGLGPAVFYEGRYGWQARFADGYEVNPHTAVEAPHLVIARYQVQTTMRQEGEPDVRHPFVPPPFWAEYGSGETESA